MNLLKGSSHALRAKRNMYRIGTDIVEVDRIKRSVSRDHFKNRVFSPEEISLIEKKKNKFESYAGNWAAKEAFSKALGTGVRSFSLTEVAVLRNDLGKPYLKLSGNALLAANGLSFDVSISHTDKLAIATVIAFKE